MAAWLQHPVDLSKSSFLVGDVLEYLIHEYAVE